MSTAADNLADTLAQTSLNDTNGDAHVDAAAASADEGRRLYIGNLAYATTEGQLKEFFNGYTIESVAIPVNPRTNRPVGYAFVDLATAHEAQDAIQQLSGKEILERKVSVQVARKPEPAEAKEGAVSGGEGASGGEGRKRGLNRGRGRGRGRGGRFARGGRLRTEANGEPEDAVPTNIPGQVIPLTEAATESEAAKEAKARGPRVQKQRGPPEDGIPSKTKVMVANLPYDLNEEKLKELFKDFEPVSAKIALRPIPRFMIKKLQARNEPRKGRGFGFVTLASEALQEKAVQEMNGKEIEGREIAVKVAIDSPGKEDIIPGEGEEQATEPATEEATA
jgi:RNA recognition motif-containing protein